jgi:hypothetical protein
MLLLVAVKLKPGVGVDEREVVTRNNHRNKERWKKMKREASK